MSLTKKLNNGTNSEREGSKEDLSRFHILNNRGNPVGVLDVAVCKYIMENVPMFVIGKLPYLYENGVYMADEQGCRLKEIIQHCLYEEFIKSPTINRIYDLLIGQHSLQKTFEEINQYPRDWINFRNGMLDVRNNVLMPHDPRYYAINQIPYSFDMEYNGSNEGQMLIDQFLEQALPDADDREMFWQYFGVCLTRDTGFQKFMMFKGPGGTGKSVLIGVMEAIVGPLNCCTVSIQDLNKRFYATSLFGKLMNACADIPSEAMKQTNVLKKAVGEDMLLYEKKGRDPTKFRSYAKLVFSANEMPLNLDDKTNAYYRRLLVLEMKQTVTEEKRDPELKTKLIKEWKYILYQCVNALQRLYLAGHFSVSENSRKCVEDLNRAADSVKAFLDDQVRAVPGKRILRSEMYRAYERYCEEGDRQALGKTGFFRCMEERGYSLGRDPAQGFYYKNVDFTQEEFVPVTEQDFNPFEQMSIDDLPSVEDIMLEHMKS